MRRLLIVDKYVIELNEFPSEGLGSLLVLDRHELPFIPHRVFLVHDVPKGVKRGAHAHKICNQLIIVVQGTAEILIDDGYTSKKIIVDNPKTAILIPKMTWSTQHTLSNSSTICVLASDQFDDKDYIYDYNDFIRFKAAKE